MKSEPSILDALEIASPCSAAWDEMQGSDTRRFCAHCQLNVYNISGMSRAEAEELVRTNEGRHGTVLTRDCPVGLKAVRRALVRSALLAGAMVAFVLLCGLRAITFGRTPGQGPIADLVDRIHPRVLKPVLMQGGAPCPAHWMGRIRAPGLNGNAAPTSSSPGSN